MEYKGKSPCKTCPYRKDVPLRHWAIEEFKGLLDSEKEQFGRTYGCHKKDDTVCKGWLMNQDKRNFPSIMLRLSLTKNKITREYLDKLTCAVEMFDTVEDMCYTNYPELKTKK